MSFPQNLDAVSAASFGAETLLCTMGGLIQDSRFQALQGTILFHEKLNILRGKNEPSQCNSGTGKSATGWNDPVLTRVGNSELVACLQLSNWHPASQALGVVEIEHWMLEYVSVFWIIHMVVS